ncbi:phosphoribosylaminoimidazolesuccinocarboxamide synthase [Bacillus sp. SD088]|uniref:phosphoribosylaminoimidazolesuccinocarboxamide synthase n=1 Tax=Bacillus sp. SD088 TaxID=2782012 RepID=UPI001A963BA6|nr:phosphoribosylaminoimidazolesuccinocarboxamide synthase [Bacillus sp. SD088]MBO0991698.1 phosphoribosylaminoimidazolesuccinocarboxamide synthase [Bacillus sp. SD088]
MNLKYRGKTKDVYELENGHCLLKFKDDVTGEDGVFDPGANTVGLQIEGAGKAGLKLTKHFFEILREQEIPTHYVDAHLDEAEMIVKPATIFGSGLEVICRYRATGSFMKRYGKYATEGQDLGGFVEVTLKDDERQDPPISADALELLGILSLNEYAQLKALTRQIGAVVKKELLNKGIELYDIKFEFGKTEAGEMMLIDEISGGNMRAYKDGVYIEPLALEKLMNEA